MKNKSRNIPTTISILLTLTALGGTVIAQEESNGGMDRGERHQRGPGKRQPDPEQMLRGITQRLDLNETQIQQVRNIIDATKPEFDAIRESSRVHRQARRDLNETDADYAVQREQLESQRRALAATSTELRTRVRSDIDAILTPEQREKFAAQVHDERRQRRGDRRRGGDNAEGG